MRLPCRALHLAFVLPALLAAACVPPVELKVQAGDVIPEGHVVPTCDMGDTITLTVEAPHCAVDGFVVSLVIGSGEDRFGHHYQFGGKVDQGGTIPLTIALDFRDAFHGDNVDVTVHSRCADGRKARGTFRCRAPGTERPLPT